VVTTLAKFSAALNALRYKSLKHLAIYLCQTQDWGVLHWCSTPLETLPEVPCDLLKFENSLPRWSHRPPISGNWSPMLMRPMSHANELHQCWSTAGYGWCLAGGEWHVNLAHNPSVHRVPLKRNSLQLMLQLKSQSVFDLCFMNWVTLRRSLLSSMRTTTWQSRLWIKSNPLIVLAMATSDILHFSIILIHLPGVANPADMLTKALGWVLHHRHTPYLMGHYGNPCQ